MARKKVGGTTNKVMNRGAWTEEEDRKLADYVRTHGDRKWRSLPAKAGLNRCGKSCRLRWLNYLRPGIKRGNITEEEEDLIIRLHNLLGNRWSLIAGRLPGRTDNEIKNHWNTHLSKKAVTIDELNFKLNQKLKNIDQGSNEAAIPVKSITDYSQTLGFPEKFTSNSVGFDCISTIDDWLDKELELDFNGIFDFSSILAVPDSDPLISSNFTTQIDSHFTNEDSFHDISGNQFDVEMLEMTEKQSPFHQSTYNNLINVHALNWLLDIEDHVSLHLPEGILL